MNTLDASKLQANHYPGGIEVLALRLGKSAETLRKELDGHPNFKLGLLAAVAISDMCMEAKSAHCTAFINVIAAASGGFVRLPVLAAPPPRALQASLAAAMREISDVVMAVTRGDSDDKISDNDLHESVTEIHEARAALQQLEQCLRSKNAAGKPQGGGAV